MHTRQRTDVFSPACPTADELIEQIRRINPTAEPRFLASFQRAQLAEYLKSLQVRLDKRAYVAAWVDRKKLALRVA